MYAVIKSGGKQHRVEEGEILRLEKLEAATGEEVSFDNILMVGEGESVKLVRLMLRAVRLLLRSSNRVELIKLRSSNLIDVSIRVKHKVIVSGLRTLRLLELKRKAGS